MLSFAKEQIKEISEQLDCGFRAFYHKQSGELLFVPNTEKFIDIDEDAWKEEIERLEKDFIFYQEVYAMESSDSFKVMADFTEQLNDVQLQSKLFDALNKRKPFREFKFIIDHSGQYRQQWFDFKNKRLMEWTKDQIIPQEL